MIVFFLPTRFHLFSQLKHFRNTKDAVIYSIYTKSQFKARDMGESTFRIRTLWVSLIIYGLWRYVRRSRFFAGYSFLFRKLFIKSCEAEFCFRAKFVTFDRLVFMAGFLGASISSRKFMNVTLFAIHGSLYERAAREVMLRAVQEVGADVKESSNWTSEYIINRMDLEFDAATKIIVCSPTAYNTFPKKYRGKLYVVPLGSPAWLSTSAQRQLRPRSARLRAVHVSNLALLKNLDRTIAGASMASVEVELVVCGGGGRRLADLKHKYRDCEWIKFLGSVPHTQLADILSDCDVLIHAAHAEGWGMVVSEALACGLQVIASENTGCAAYYKRSGPDIVKRSISTVDPLSIASIAAGFDEVDLRLKTAFEGSDRLALANSNLVTWEDSGVALEEQLTSR